MSEKKPSKAQAKKSPAKKPGAGKAPAKKRTRRRVKRSTSLMPASSLTPPTSPLFGHVLDGSLSTFDRMMGLIAMAAGLFLIFKSPETGTLALPLPTIPDAIPNSPEWFEYLKEIEEGEET